MIEFVILAVSSFLLLRKKSNSIKPNGDISTPNTPTDKPTDKEEKSVQGEITIASIEIENALGNDYYGRSATNLQRINLILKVKNITESNLMFFRTSFLFTFTDKIVKKLDILNNAGEILKPGATKTYSISFEVNLSEVLGRTFYSKLLKESIPFWFGVQGAISERHFYYMLNTTEDYVDIMSIVKPPSIDTNPESGNDRQNNGSGIYTGKGSGSGTDRNKNNGGYNIRDRNKRDPKKRF